MGSSRCGLALIGFLLACGNAKPKTTTGGSADASGGSTTEPPPTGDDEPGASCERGRCLEDISAVVSSKRAAARACFDAAAKKKPGIEGRIIINFEIDPEGAVIDASQGMQDGQLQEPEVVSCVADVIKQLKFAKSAKGKTTRAYHRFDFAR